VSKPAIFALVLYLSTGAAVVVDRYPSNDACRQAAEALRRPPPPPGVVYGTRAECLPVPTRNPETSHP
jgi:hypothetical protein